MKILINEISDKIQVEIYFDKPYSKKEYVKSFEIKEWSVGSKIPTVLKKIHSALAIEGSDVFKN